jgi:hypothetical protein
MRDATAITATLPHGRWRRNLKSSIAVEVANMINMIIKTGAIRI